jgi:hypothetical protein
MKVLHRALPIVFAAAATAAMGQTLYEGTSPISSQGVDLRSWGSGTARETDEAAFSGSTSIRVSSRNYFQGGILVFGKPVDLSGAFADTANLLQFALRLPARATATGGGSTGGGKKGGAIGAGDEGGARGGGPTSGGVGTGGGGGGAAAQSAPSDLAALESIRVVLTTSDGKKAEAYLDVRTSTADSRGWTKVGIPLAAIQGLSSTNKAVQSLAVSCDAVATIYIGEVRILNDPTPVYGEASPIELNLALGDEQVFVATGSAGTTAARFQWDFDSSDGIQVDAEGATVRRKFRKAGTYTVTLTTVDAFGLKKPHVSTVRVVVNP